MARHPHEEGWSDDDVYPRKRGSRGWLGWLLMLCVIGAFGAFIWYLYIPLRHTRARLDGDLGDAAKRERGLQTELKQAQGKLSLLEQDWKKVSGELAQTVAEKEQVEAELKRVQGELSEKLNPEIQTGSVRIHRRGQELVLDMADQVLFDTGQAEINDRGQALLRQVAQSLATLAAYDIQVAGHTDSARVVSPTTQERFPTNWELSTARATNVVRFLQERGRIPGQRLVAAGFAEFHPAASNATEDGRQKNRRIEIILLPHGPTDDTRIH